jgi:galactokinase
MAIDRATTVELERGGDVLELHSASDAAPALVSLDITEPSLITPAWARYAAGVVAELRPLEGGRGTVTTTLPLGAGLSSSAALEVAVALALGFSGTSEELAVTCQRAEQRASGVPSGVMDQLTSAAGVAGHALLIDCALLTVTPVPLPTDAEVVIVHSGQARALIGSPYAARRAECEQAEERVGPLRTASVAAVEALQDPVLRRRARHVVTENARVAAAAEALARGDVVAVGRLMAASHASLRDDFDVSTEALDRIVADLVTTPGVFGARLTGAGFGGCVVALVAKGIDVAGQRVHAAAGAICQPLP